MDERLYFLGFSVFPGIGPVRFQQLLDYFGSAQAAWEAGLSDLENTGIGKIVSKAFVAFRPTISLTGYYEQLKKEHIWFLTTCDPAYPKLLLQSKKPPFVLYGKGKFDFNASSNQQTIAIVGTRRVTAYGEEVTRLFTQELVAAGCVIVSGLATGVDSIAHAVTIATKGKTIAVLGCGVDCCYPRENSALYATIIEHDGVIVSEYPLGMQPGKGAFPSRNRIIAGLSRAVVVTEGAEDSGSLITANDSFINGRPVFAVPGPITSSLSKGPLSLIGKGAKLVTSADEIINELGCKITNGGCKKKVIREITGDTREEQMIIDLLQNEALHFDELVRKTKLDSAKLGGVLSVLEMKGLVRSSVDGMFYLPI